MSYTLRGLKPEEYKYLFEQSYALKRTCGYIGYTLESVENLNNTNGINWLNVFENEINEDISNDIEEMLNIAETYSTISALLDKDDKGIFEYENGVYFGVRVDINNTAFLLKISNIPESSDIAMYVYNATELDRHINEAKAKGIRIIDSHYKTLFCLTDGDKIKISNPRALSYTPTCRYIDEYHTDVGGNLYHICQFAELMEERNNDVIPLRLSLPDECYYYDEEQQKAGIIRKGYDGYIEMSMGTKKPNEIKDFIAEENKLLQITPQQYKAMENGCKYGWADDRANPNNFNDKGEYTKTNKQKNIEAR